MGLILHLLLMNVNQTYSSPWELETFFEPAICTHAWLDYGPIYGHNGNIWIC